jgi:hypothetical protein
MLSAIPDQPPLDLLEPENNGGGNGNDNHQMMQQQQQEPQSSNFNPPPDPRFELNRIIEKYLFPLN